MEDEGPGTAQEHGGLRTWVKRIALLTVPVAVLILIVELYYLLTESAAVYDLLADVSYALFVFLPDRIDLVTLSGLSGQVFWIVLIVAVLASTAAVVWHSCRSYRAAEGTAEERIQKTPLYWVALSLATSMLLIQLIYLVEGLAGMDTDTSGVMALDVSGLALLLDYTFAGVWEEVIFRILPIGIPMMIVGLACRRKGWWRYLVGGFGMSKIAIVLIVISAVLFGYAHAGMWGLAKIIPMAAAGLFYGCLFVRFGVHATILMHFMNDCFVMLVEIFPGFSMLYVLLQFLGIFGLVLVLRKLQRFMPTAKTVPNWVPPEEESVFSSRRGASEDSSAE